MLVVPATFWMRKGVTVWGCYEVSCLYYPLCHLDIDSFRSFVSDVVDELSVQNVVNFVHSYAIFIRTYW